MAELGMHVSDHYVEVDRDLILLGVLFHDLGKIQEIGAMPANDYTTPGRLVGHVIFGRDMLLERCAAIENFPADLRLHLEHLILSHQGRLEFGSPVQPMTAEALALHFIDDLDSKLAQLRQASESEPALQFLKGFGRYIYTSLGDELAPPETGPDQPGPDRPEANETESKIEKTESEAPAQPRLDL
jgi:hypothetical protein